MARQKAPDWDHVLGRFALEMAHFNNFGNLLPRRNEKV